MISVRLGYSLEQYGYNYALKITSCDAFNFTSLFSVNSLSKKHLVICFDRDNLSKHLYNFKYMWFFFLLFFRTQCFLLNLNFKSECLNKVFFKVTVINFVWMQEGFKERNKNGWINDSVPMKDKNEISYRSNIVIILEDHGLIFFTCLWKCVVLAKVWHFSV